MTGYLRLKRKVFSLPKYYKATDVLFCTAFFIYVISLIMDISMWTFEESGAVNSVSTAMKLLRYLAYAIMAVKIVYDFSVEYKNIGYLVIFAAVAGLAFITSKNTMVVFYFLVILSARGISGMMVISTAFLAQGVSLISTVLISRIGFLTDYITNRHGRMRHFLGFQWATTSALLFLYMVFEYIYLRKGRIKLIEAAVIGALNVYFFVMTDSRMSFLLVFATLGFFLVFGRFLSGRKKKRGLSALVSKLIILAPWILAVGSIYLHKIFVKGQGMDKLNKLLSNRLNYGKQAIEKYGISLFGKKMIWVGYGLNDSGKGEYNYVDCSYLRISIEFGLVFLAMILLVYSLVIYKGYKSGERYLVWIMIFILLISVTESRLLNFAFNPFMLLAFAALKGVDAKDGRYKNKCINEKENNVG